VDVIVRQFFDWDAVRPYLPDLLRAFWVTLQITFLAEILCLGLGLVLVFMRRLRLPDHGRGLRALASVVRFLATAYINLMRGLPALLVLIIMWASFPFLEIPIIKNLTEFQIAAFGLGLVYAAYIAEVYRSGIDSVDSGQTEAARSLGMSERQAMGFVVLPQAIRRVLPPLLNDFIALSKDVALAGVIAVNEVVSIARDAQSITFNSTPLVAAAVFYLLLTLPMVWALDRIIAREGRRSGRGQIVTP
jgi:polar amino acid transport system permease protein